MPCLDRASPSSGRNGTHWDWHRVHCLLHPQIPGEAAQFSAHTGSTDFQKGMGNPALPTMPGEALCLSFPLCDRPTGTRSDPATSTPSWARSPASTLPSCGGEVTNSLDPRQRCCSALGALHAPAMHTHPCSARDAPYVHPGSCTVRGEDAHVRPRTTQEQSPRVPPATCTTAAAPHARPLRAP